MGAQTSTREHFTVHHIERDFFTRDLDNMGARTAYVAGFSRQYPVTHVPLPRFRHARLFQTRVL